MAIFARSFLRLLEVLPAQSRQLTLRGEYLGLGETELEELKRQGVV